MSPFEPLREPLRAARPRRIRQSTTPKTPEPSAESQEQPPSPPRPKFRLRRRTTSQLSAPTQQFLASVAAADVPVPSIEGPQVYDDEDMISIAYPVISQLDRIDDVKLRQHLSPSRTFSPPKTPAPDLAPSLSSKQFPDWSIDATFSSLESSPEYESSRPSTARSTQTSSSLFSRYSLASEELSQCASPESEQNDRFGHFLAPEDAGRTFQPLAITTRSAKSRRAPWTKAMSQHLWSTYTMYLQDPKVTPFRVGKSGIPPSGVCMRVAREAKRSWKGSRPLVKPGNKSGSSTPTAEAAGPYIEWPHTCAATRGYLRELCKAHSGSASRNLQSVSSSPAPFGKSVNRLWNRRTVPTRSPSVFSSSDMAMSLTVCTSDSMQLQGPLAQLTSSQPETSAHAEASSDQPFLPFSSFSEQTKPRLGSPFMARSYGPSSSSGLEETFNVGSEAQRQTRTIGTRRGLASPVRLDQSRPNTQKRRSRQPGEPPRRTKRPSLGSDFWTDPASNETEACNAPLIDFSSTETKHHDSMFVPRTNLQELFETSRAGLSLTGSASFPPATGLTPSQTVPARLGSPFAAKGTSHSFPNRHSSVSAIDIGAVFRPFASMHQTGGEKSNTTSSASSSKTPFASRLAHLDEQLRGFQRKDRNYRRSQSPF